MDDFSPDKTVTVLEWADRLLPRVSRQLHPKRIIKVRFKVTGKTKRLLTIEARPKNAIMDIKVISSHGKR
jgi:tRNA A37 threonylcarbamoyladenosine biosynthesis protein TsaE